MMLLLNEYLLRYDREISTGTVTDSYLDIVTTLPYIIASLPPVPYITRRDDDAGDTAEEYTC